MQTEASSSRFWIVFLLLVLTITLVLLSMFQVDRQWLKLQEMQATMAEQANVIRDLRGALASGAFVSGGHNAAAGKEKSVAQAFRRAYAASLMPDYAAGDWSVEAFGNNLKTITPLISSDAYAANVQGYVLESLLVRDPDTLAWQGLLADRWTVSDDGLAVSFHLRDDVVFSDGAPLTAEDVLFTYQFIMSEAIQAPRERAYLKKIKEVKVKDKYTVEFTYAEPYFEALSLAGGMGILPKHFYEPYLQQPQKFNESKGLLLGSGPFKLSNPESWTPDQGAVELVRNERYWGDTQPSFSRILWKIIQNDSARLTTFRNGEIDTYSARPLEYESLKQDPQITAASQNFEYMPPVVGYSYIAWNQLRGGKPTRFADRRVRQAMTYLTDVDRVIKDVMLGYAEPAVSPFGPNSPQHDPALTPYAYDLGKAKALLAEAGYRDGNGDGVLEDAQGQPFEFKLTYFQANDDTKRIVLLLKDLYAKAGVKLIPTPQEWPVMLENLEKKDFDAITLGWTSSIETDLFQAFHGSQAVSKGDNFVSYQNPELDVLIDQARRTVDEKLRMPFWRQAEHVLYADQPYTFLMRRKSLLFVDRRIKNVQMTKLGLNLDALPQEIYVPRSLQKYAQ